MLALLLIVVLMLWPQHGILAPVPAANNATIETTGWVSEPATRGTFRLIFSCLTTLTACVYTAVHLNVPKHGTSKVARYTRKAGWVVLGVLAPEFVVYTAWAQWHSARKLQAEVNTIIEEKKNNSNAKASADQEHWTLTHAFYAGMGGFVVDIKLIDGKGYIAGSPRLTVTARGTYFLAINGIIPEISKAFIDDKSKASAFAKVFACTQGGWLILQTIARLCYKLPITLLEINTVGHVCCALAIYWFWLRKPLDIEEPTVISEQVYPNLPSLCALMWMNSSISERGIKRHPKASKSGTELESLLFYMPAVNHQERGPNSDGLENSPLDSQSLSPDGKTVAVVSLGKEDTQIHLYRDQILHNTVFALDPSSERFSKVSFSSGERLSFKMGRGSGPGIPRTIELDSTDIRRWQMASQALTTNPSLLEEKNFKPAESRSKNSFAGWKYKELLCARARDWPGKALEGKEATLFRMRNHLAFNSFSFFLAIATAVYGGLHAAAWNGYFPTETERNLWRFSSLTVGASGSVFIALLSLPLLINHLNEESAWGTIFMLIDLTFVFVAGIGLAVAFVFSRTFLIVEAFISFRSLPVDAYSSPAWLQDLVHL